MRAEAAPPGAPPLQDGRGRRISYLRLSLTPRCNFRCSYCTPGRERMSAQRLSREQIARLVAVLARLGIRRVRLTGGEPTLRPDLVDIAADLAALPGIEEIALTTNGQLLAGLAAPLRRAGVSRLNVSLDSLRPERLRALSGPAASLPRIVAGIEAAVRTGFASLKLNTVVIQGTNEDELGDLVHFAWAHGAVPRFIELMPFGPGAPVPVAAIRALLGAQGVRLAPDPTRGWGPATYWRGESGAGPGSHGGLVGFIGAMTEPFCEGCNRMRIAADGSLRPCLGRPDRIPLGPALREGDEDAIAAAVRLALASRADGHGMRGAAPAGSMVAVGG